MQTLSIGVYYLFVCIDITICTCIYTVVQQPPFQCVLESYLLASQRSHEGAHLLIYLFTKHEPSGGGGAYLHL